MARQKTQEIFNAAVASGQFFNSFLNCEGHAMLGVWWQMLATTTPGDMTGWSVSIPRVDAVTFSPVGITAVRGFGASASDGANLNFWAQYDVRGIPKVRIFAQNNNVGSKTVIVTCYLGSEN